MKTIKTLSLVLAITMLFLLSCATANASTSTSFASSELSEPEIDAALVNRGYPQPVLDAMSISAKTSIYDDASLYFKGAVITTYDENTHTFVDYEVQPDGIVPCGQIPTADLTLVWDINGDKNNPNLIHIKYSYRWTRLPVFRWQDTISVSWDNSLFEMVARTFHKVDQYDGQLVDPSTGITTGYVSNATHSEEYGYANASAAGVSWYADLKGYIGIIPSSLHGFCEFSLEKKTSTSGNSNIYGHYVHPQVAIGVTVVVNRYGTFNVSGTGLYDERGNHTSFSY